MPLWNTVRIAKRSDWAVDGPKGTVHRATLLLDLLRVSKISIWIPKWIGRRRIRRVVEKILHWKRLRSLVWQWTWTHPHIQVDPVAHGRTIIRVDSAILIHTVNKIPSIRPGTHIRGLRVSV